MAPADRQRTDAGFPPLRSARGEGRAGPRPALPRPGSPSPRPGLGVSPQTGESHWLAVASRAAAAPLPSRAAGVRFLPAPSAPTGTLRKGRGPRVPGQCTAPGDATIPTPAEQSGTRPPRFASTHLAGRAGKRGSRYWKLILKSPAEQRVGSSTQAQDCVLRKEDWVFLLHLGRIQMPLCWKPSPPWLCWRGLACCPPGGISFLKPVPQKQSTVSLVYPCCARLLTADGSFLSRVVWSKQHLIAFFFLHFRVTFSHSCSVLQLLTKLAAMPPDSKGTKENEHCARDVVFGRPCKGSLDLSEELFCVFSAISCWVVI